MTLGELIALLQVQREQYGGDIDVVVEDDDWQEWHIDVIGIVGPRSGQEAYIAINITEG